MNRFAAAQIETVKACELLLLFRALFFICGANRREQDIVFVLPEITRFLTEIGQLPERAVIEPETAFIAILVLVAVRHNERRTPAVRRVFHVGKVLVIQKISDADRFHS